MKATQAKGSCDFFAISRGFPIHGVFFVRANIFSVAMIG